VEYDPTRNNEVRVGMRVLWRSSLEVWAFYNQLLVKVNNMCVMLVSEWDETLRWI